MRNLRNIQRSSQVFGRNSSSNEFPPLTATAWIDSSHSTLCTFGPSKDDDFIQLRRFHPFSLTRDDGDLIATWEVSCSTPPGREDPIVCLQYFADTESCCLVF